MKRRAKRRKLVSNSCTQSVPSAGFLVNLGFAGLYGPISWGNQLGTFLPMPSPGMESGREGSLGGLEGAWSLPSEWNSWTANW